MESISRRLFPTFPRQLQKAWVGFISNKVFILAEVHQSWPFLKIFFPFTRLNQFSWVVLISQSVPRIHISTPSNYHTNIGECMCSRSWIFFHFNLNIIGLYCVMCHIKVTTQWITLVIVHNWMYIVSHQTNGMNVIANCY